MTNTPPPQVATILWLQNLTKPYNFCELIHFCQGLKRHHILKQDELDTSDFSLVLLYQWQEAKSVLRCKKTSKMNLYDKTCLWLY